MIGFFVPCFLIFAALFGGRANALVVDYPDFLQSDLPGYVRILCNSAESYLKLSSIGQDPVLSRLGQEISRIGICEPGHRLFFFQRVSDQDVQRLLLIRDQLQQRVSEIQQMHLLLALVLISVFALLALVILSRAGKRIAQVACWMYFDLMLAIGFVWKLDYESFMRITDASWGLAQELVYRSKDLILLVLDWICEHVGNPNTLDWLFFYMFSLICIGHGLLNFLCRRKSLSSSGKHQQANEQEDVDEPEPFTFWRILESIKATFMELVVLKIEMMWLYPSFHSIDAMIAGFPKGYAVEIGAAENNEEILRAMDRIKEEETDFYADSELERRLKELGVPLK
jgi:hypothetical protein